MTLSIVVMSVKNVTVFHQSTRKLKNGKENAAHTFVTPFLIFATVCILIPLNAWKEQTLLVIAVIRVWIVLQWIPPFLQNPILIIINAPRSFATQFTKHALKPIIPKKNANKLQMTLLIVAVNVLTHAMMDQNPSKPKNGNTNATHDFVTQWLMFAVMFTPIRLGVRKEQM
jgi:hypothetical protein